MSIEGGSVFIRWVAAAKYKRRDDFPQFETKIEGSTLALVSITSK